MENRTRYTLTASALGNYFGVGFLDPMQQLEIDLGLVANEVDSESEERMMLGQELENGVLNFFERKLQISITDRNLVVKEGMNGMLRYKLDGKTILNGEETVVEAKVSNSQSSVFTNNLGYIMQCNSYMKDEGVNQALLCGLYHGKPIYKIIRRDESIIKDIEEMVVEVYSILNGITDVSSFPWHLVEKYSTSPKLETLTELEDSDFDYVVEYDMLSKSIKEQQKTLDSIKAYLKSKYNNVRYVNKELGYSFSISEQSRKGFLDEIALSMEFPNLDLDKFRKENSESKVIRVYKKG